ncbi:MAG: calcineurin-like phosphoesterase C-terminal domain-containing protein [Prevotellaceae bacterium]|jgi:glycerophosphoryl diester phosphodiesterase|nr:calcineurin-like phosphoesterase C-terminal domain-containing protein [Prevotellaceae bacterium]
MKKIIVTLLYLLLVANLYSQQVTGVVRSGETNIANVVVTDGKNFAVTDEKGQFVLDADINADFIYIATPAGYTAEFDSGTPVFYKKFDVKIKKYDFDLIKWGNTENYTLVAIADPQPKTDEHFDEYKTQIFPDIKNTIEEYGKNTHTTVAGIMLGDIVWDAFNLFEPIKKLNSTVKAPIYPVIGNHDHDQSIEGDDYASAEKYREMFGPNYYAFNIGKDYVVVLDNIIYNTRRNYKEAITENQLDWLKKYLNYVPKGSHVIIAMHAPFARWWDSKNKIMINGEKLINVCRDYKVNVLSGHLHRNHNIEINPNFFENNIAAINGSLWVGYHNDDGTPRGYKVFESDGKKFSWYYKSVGKPRNYQMEIFNKGQSKYHPNKIVAAIWDWDENRTVECYQDGKKINIDKVFDVSPYYLQEIEVYRDKSKRKYINDNRTYWYFAANPEENAKQINIVVKDNFGRIYADSLLLEHSIDVQAHRGGAGLMPENTVDAMIHAINLGVSALEFDLNISKDKKVVVSHDPWMNYKFVTRPDGAEIKKEEAKHYSLYSMTYDSIAKYETGMKLHPDFPTQKKIKTHKPLVSDLIDSVENYTVANKISPVLYNIEIKSAEGRDNVFSPSYQEFCDLAMEILLSKNINDRLVVQSFDPRTLNYLHEKYPDIKLSYNVENKDNDFEINMEKLNFVPVYYSPHFSLVNENLLKKCRDLGMKIVVWTVDKIDDIKQMLDFKVDAIISNYPDIVLKQIRKY